ncbi:hypothetical protein FEM48_Zijuj03G0004700 [Ziziphus jujuba var. spinosa]|uniref:RING-type E3 ubiquitin transferase n=1 Tax=Ziziphus jujuba var. spinosa TaxID=714518 RepID=A0A978VM52_ZIZJJ|nr:protein goliath-like [Ziziphus jujuba var. spinosa]KAH7536627.1 hypothetical protein FEM48_Zijuj03G0004700 [Ziziphus jujuba var. spinosa]
MAINISIKGDHLPDNDYSMVHIIFNQTIRQFRNLGGIELILVSEFSSAPEQWTSIYINSDMLSNQTLSRNHICNVVSKNLKLMYRAVIDHLADKILTTIESLSETTKTDADKGFYLEAEVEVVTEDVVNYMSTMVDVYNVDQSDKMVGRDSRSAIDKLKVEAEFNGDSGGRCGICVKEYFTTNETELIRRLPCLHVYHHDCVISWFEKHNSCPSCRL